MLDKGTLFRLFFACRRRRILECGTLSMRACCGAPRALGAECVLNLALRGIIEGRGPNQRAPVSNVRAPMTMTKNRDRHWGLSGGGTRAQVAACNSVRVVA